MCVHRIRIHIRIYTKFNLGTCNPYPYIGNITEQFGRARTYTPMHTYVGSTTPREVMDSFPVGFRPERREEKWETGSRGTARHRACPCGLQQPPNANLSKTRFIKTRLFVTCGVPRQLTGAAGAGFGQVRMCTRGPKKLIIYVTRASGRVCETHTRPLQSNVFIRDCCTLIALLGTTCAAGLSAIRDVFIYSMPNYYNTTPAC